MDMAEKPLVILLNEVREVPRDEVDMRSMVEARGEDLAAA